MDDRDPRKARDIEPDRADRDATGEPGSGDGTGREANPSHTTEDGVTAPKFGSAGSGGAEYEPGPGT